MRKIFVKKGLRELWKHKVQYIFLIIILGLGVSMYSSLYDLGASREATLDAIYEETNFMDVQVKVLYGQTVNLSTLDNILKKPGVVERIDKIEYRLSFDVFINHTTDEGIKTTKGIIMGYEAFSPDGQPREPTINKPLFFVDKSPVFSAPNAEQCILERKFAKAYDLAAGDQITVMKGPKKAQLDILEQANIPEYFFVIPEGSIFPSERSLGVIITPIDTAHELYFENASGEKKVNDLVILLNDPDDQKDFEEIITHEFENIGIAVKTIGKEENPSRAFLYDDLKNDRESTGIFPIIIFIVSAFGLIMVLRRMISVHRAQIGIFKALGVPDRVVLSYFSLIGIFVAIFGTIAGFLFAIPINSSFESLLNDLYDFAIMKMSISWEYYIYAGIISLVLCLGCTILPTWWALRIKPIDAIQNREGLSTKKIGKLSGKVGRKSRMPVPLKLTLRNLIRKPGRSLTSIIGVALALALFLSFAILMDSVMMVLDKNAELSKWDYEIIMDGFSPVNITQDWQNSYSEIEAVNPGILLPTKLSGNGNNEECIIYALEDVRNAYTIDLEKGKFENGGMIISEYHSKKLDIEPGDKVELEVPLFSPDTGFTMEKVNITISSVHSNHFGFYVFMDLSTMHKLTNLFGSANIIYLNLEDGESSQSLENELITTSGVSSVTYSKDRENLLEQYFVIFVTTVYLIALLSVGLAAAIVYNLFMINAQENRRNYATMKTLGTSLRRLGYLIFIEAGFIILFGVILGGIGGYFLAIGMILEASEFEAWNLEIIFSWNWFIAGTLLIILVVVLVSLLTIRYINRINIADVIRERSY